MKPRLLDLFCCAGGAGMGYFLAGFDVVGVDIRNQLNYPFPFVKDDAINYLTKNIHNYDVIHASPPCQAYSKHVKSKSSKWNHTLGIDEPKLIAELKKILANTGKPYIIENVTGARGEMREDLLLCGVMFGLPIARHRIFEISIGINQPQHIKCRGIAKQYSKIKGWAYRDMSVTGKGRNAGTSDRWKEILGINWNMTQHELAESIPPAYTEYIGTEIIKVI